MRRSTADLVSEFSHVLTGIGGQPYLAKNKEETTKILRGIVERVGAREVVIAELPNQVGDVVKAALGDFPHSITEDLAKDKVLEVLARADIGITWADFAIAKRGALIEVGYDDSIRLTSSLPFTHIALISSGKILDDIEEAMAKVGAIVRSSSPKGRPVVSFIAGPSKTGDIEMKLLYGVHGPNELHVLILDWAQ